MSIDPRTITLKFFGQKRVQGFDGECHPYRSLFPGPITIYLAHALSLDFHLSVWLLKYSLSSQSDSISVHSHETCEIECFLFINTFAAGAGDSITRTSWIWNVILTLNQLLANYILCDAC